MMMASETSGGRGWWMTLTIITSIVSCSMYSDSHQNESDYGLFVVFASNMVAWGLIYALGIFLWRKLG
jgi:hypothetical protein